MNLHPYYQGPFFTRIDKGQLVAYGVSGFVTTATDYLTFTLCYTMLATGLLEATIIAYIAGLTVSYLQNRFWVYRKTASEHAETTNLWRYAIFLLVNLAITYVMLDYMQHNFGITPYIGKFIVGLFMFFWIYLGNRYFVFPAPKIGPIKL
jgi:putative flippase GtrA